MSRARGASAYAGDVPVFAELGSFFRASLLDPVRDDEAEPPRDVRRRRIVVGLTLALGAVALGFALGIQAGDPWFYPATLGVAAIWVIGAFASGKLHLGRARTRSGGSSYSVLQAFILGGMLLAVFLAGAVVVGRINWLRAPVDTLLAHARFGSLPIVAAITAVNGVAEELFFRGALFAAISRRWRVVGSAGLYALATVFTGVPLLVLAAAALGLLTGLQRRVTGGVLGPIVTHLTWSLGMLFLLPLALDVWR